MMESYDLNTDLSIVSSEADFFDFPFDNQLPVDFGNEKSWTANDQPVIASLAEKADDQNGQFDINQLDENQLNKVFGLSTNQQLLFDQEAFNDSSSISNSMPSWIENTFPDLFNASDIAQQDYTDVQNDVLLNTDDSEFASEFSSNVSSPFESANSSPLQSVASSPFASMASSPAPSSAECSPYPVEFSNGGITIKSNTSRSRKSKGAQKPKKNTKRKRLHNLPVVAKQQRKRLQNNNAALKYRLKKKEEVSSLSTVERDLERENMRLRQNIEATRSEINFLASLLREIEQNRNKATNADR